MAAVILKIIALMYAP